MSRKSKRAGSRWAGRGDWQDLRAAGGCWHPVLEPLSNELIVMLSRRGWPHAFLLEARQAGGQYCRDCNRILGYVVS